MRVHPINISFESYNDSTVLENFLKVSNIFFHKFHFFKRKNNFSQDTIKQIMKLKQF